MYKQGKYTETDKMSDLICENYPMVLVMSRFGIDLGFGEKNIGDVCRQNEVDSCTLPDRCQFPDGRDSRHDKRYRQLPLCRFTDYLSAQCARLFPELPPPAYPPQTDGSDYRLPG